MSGEIYIQKILKGVDRGLRISAGAIEILVSLCKDVTYRLGLHCIDLLAHGKKKTLSAKEIKVSTRLLFKGEVAKHAVVTGLAAIQRAQTDLMPPFAFTRHDGETQVDNK
eukprot:gene10219-11905_t